MCVVNTDLVSDYSSFQRGKLAGNQLTNQTLAANCIVLWLVVPRGKWF